MATFAIKLYCVFMFNYYNWTEISSMSTNWLFLESVLTWEDSSFLLNSDIFFVLGVFLPASLSLFFSTTAQLSTSSLDFIMTFSTSFAENFLLNSFFFDSLLTLTTLHSLNSYFFFSNQGDFILSAAIAEGDYIFFFFWILSNLCFNHRFAFFTLWFFKLIPDFSIFRLFSILFVIVGVISFFLNFCPTSYGH